MEPITTIISHAVPLLLDDIDTDQIIPARYLKTTSKDGLGEALFADWRYNLDGALHPEFALNQPSASGGRILIARNNFGCGSSREHALWALGEWGFEAVIALSFADIFRSNALKNGLIPVEVDVSFFDDLLRAISKDPIAQISVDLSEQLVSIEGGQRTKFPIDPFARECLLKGIDQLDYVLSLDEEISAYEVTHERG
jgi:3-isopropylmalate/(R)-2-methylmalate dehydratase small subunit